MVIPDNNVVTDPYINRLYLICIHVKMPFICIYILTFKRLRNFEITIEIVVFCC